MAKFFSASRNPTFPAWRRFLNGLVLFIPFIFLAGCEPKLEVRVYKAPKQTNVLAQTTSQPKRSLAAIIPHGTSVFYLKAMDAPERLDGLVAPFTQLTKDVTFSNAGAPVWKLPEGWREAPGSGMSIAIIEAPIPGKLVSFAVTQLAMPEDNWEKYLEDNVNRWRGQLSLPRISLAEQKPELTEVVREGESLPAYVVDLVGKSSGEGMGGPFSGAPMSGGPMSGGPMSGGPMSGPAQGQAPSRSTEPEEPSPLRFKAPEGWTDTGTGPFRLASFKIVEGDLTGEVTVSAAKTDDKGNAIMWQRQLMNEADSAVVEKNAMEALEKGEPIKSSLGAGSLYLFRESDTDSSMALLIAVIPVEGADASLFAKLRGPYSLTMSQRNKLIEFVESLRIEGIK